MYSYRFLDGADELGRLYDALHADGVLGALYRDVAPLTREMFVRMLSAEGMGVIGGFADGALAGVMTVQAFRGRLTRCAEIGVAARRAFFACAEPLTRGAFLWAFATLDCDSMVGIIPAGNRHALRMAPRVGFHALCRAPGMCWYAEKQRFEDGVIVFATPQTVKQACEV